MRNICFFAVLLSAATFLLPAKAFADTTLVYENAQGKPVMFHYMTESQVRSEDHTNNTIMIFDGNTGNFFILYPDKREYTALNAEAMTQNATGPLAAFQKQMESMSPQQREMMKGMMGSLLKKFEPAVQEGETVTVAGYECQQLTLMMGSKVTSEMCMADPDALGISTAEIATLQQLTDKVQELANSFLAGFGIDLSALNKIKGVPVRITENGNTKTLAKVSEDDIPAQLFTIPEGYTKKALGQ